MNIFLSLSMTFHLIPFRSRDDKRYTEKKNKSERARRKKEDIAKLRNLVDMTLRYSQEMTFAFAISDSL